MTDEMQREEDDAAAVNDGREEQQGALDLGSVGDDGDFVPTAVEQELRGELEALNDRHLRLAAEFDNYRKRNERDRSSLAARLQVDLVRPLLDVLDDLERMSEGAGVDESAVAEGVRLVEKKFRSVLEAAGVELLDVEGVPFDPAVMEALMTVPTSDPEQDGRVADVFQKGYRYGDALIRPARVRVLEYDEAAASE